MVSLAVTNVGTARRQSAPLAQSHHSTIRLMEDSVIRPVMNLNEVRFDDVEENGLYTSSRGQIVLRYPSFPPIVVSI